MKKVAVVGHGFLGKWHLEKAVSHFGEENVMVIDPSSEQLAAAKEKFPQISTSKDVESVIGELKAGIVVTPTSFHFEIVKNFLNRGIHVFCEKPVTSTLAQAKELKEILNEKKDLVLQVGHSERFHEVWEKANEWSKFFTEKSDVKIYRGAPFKGRATDVDVVSDLMIHDIDLMLYLFKERPISVFSYGEKIRTDKWDYVHSLFQFSSGRVVSITVGRNQTKEKREIEVTNRHGSLQIDLCQFSWVIAKNDELELEKGSYQKRDHLFIEQSHFKNSIENNKEAIINIDDGIAAIELIDAVLKSLETSKVVEL